MSDSRNLGRKPRKLRDRWEDPDMWVVIDQMLRANGLRRWLGERDKAIDCLAAAAGGTPRARELAQALCDNVWNLW